MRTPFLRILQKAILTAKRASFPNQAPIDELLDEAFMRQETQSRRDFLALSAKAAAFAGISTLIPQRLFATPPTQKIAIIGGGLAGLTTGYYLKRAGITNFTIYESDARIGGRVHTLKNVIGKNLLTEVGGEFINSGHKDMLRLVRDADLELIDIYHDPLDLKMDAFFFEGKHFTMEEIATEFKNIMPTIATDYSLIDRKYSTVDARRFDTMPLEKYIDKLECSTSFNKLLKSAYTAEYGLETGEQSALNLIELIDKEMKNNTLSMYGNNDRRYKIKGGNSSLLQYLAKYLAEHIVMDMRLTQISASKTGISMTLNEKEILQADVVVLTIPFSVLRNISMDIESLTMRKRATIQTLGYGTNAKLMMGVNYRMWRSRGYMGNLYNEFVQNGWDNGVFQNQLQNKATEGGYTVYLGGEAGQTVKKGMEKEMTDMYLPILDGVFPKFSQSYNGLSAVSDWTSSPHSLGSYSCFKKGQRSTLIEFDNQPFSNVMFAGEHCSRNYSGTMNGAAETGRMAAQAIISVLKPTP
jgi:monoamine oxidase